MKIILSRKGFDSSSGGMPSPKIGHTMLSLPIPAESHSGLKFEDLQYIDAEGKTMTYADIIRDLERRKSNPSKIQNPEKGHYYCHLDPDIRENVRVAPVAEWKPAFGQTGTAQSILKNLCVKEGDLFLFFGLYKDTENRQGRLTFAGNGFQAIYGYLQIGEIVSMDSPKFQEYNWHPHAKDEMCKDNRNTLYLPATHLSWDATAPGYGALEYRDDRVLTKKGHSAATWKDSLKEMKIYGPTQIHDGRKNSASNGGLYYAGQWQELVLKESLEATEWAKKIISDKCLTNITRRK